MIQGDQQSVAQALEEHAAAVQCARDLTADTERAYGHKERLMAAGLVAIADAWEANR